MIFIVSFSRKTFSIPSSGTHTIRGKTMHYRTLCHFQHSTTCRAKIQKETEITNYKAEKSVFCPREGFFVFWRHLIPPYVGIPQTSHGCGKSDATTAYFSISSRARRVTYFPNESR